MLKFARSARQLLMVTLVATIGPFALVAGLLALWSPDKATAFVTGYTGFLAGLPEAFWLFAGTVVLGHQVTRGYGEVKTAEAEAINNFVENKGSGASG